MSGTGSIDVQNTKKYLLGIPRTTKVPEKQMKKYKIFLRKFCGTLFGTKLAFSCDKMYKIEFS